MPAPKHVHRRDLENLRESGLTDATIRRNRLHTENGALVFPYRSLDGTVNGFARKRPHNPRVIDGKAVKYEQPPGSPLRGYFPVGSLPKLRKGDNPVYITEGEKKALALSQLNIAAIGIGGVWCWKKKGVDELIDDLVRIDWEGRIVYVVFDYDEKPRTRRQVQNAMRRLAKALRTAGAKEVYAVDLPPGPKGSKQGVDDFMVAHGDEAFHPLVKRAEAVPNADYEPMTKAAGRTDTANAARLVAKFGDDIRWVGAWDKWLIWDGRRWSIDQTLRTEAFAKRIAKELWKEIAAMMASGDVDKDQVGTMVLFAKASNSANGIRNMVALARSEPGVPVGIEELDTNPLLLNVENGTLELSTGKLREHKREDFITKLAPVTFQPRARCPEWNGFLRRILDKNDDLIGYMRRLVGYCLTGLTQEHILPFLYGTGANGKSTLVERLLTLMGSDYAMKAPPDLLMAKRGESHPTERADLFGKRLAACVETEDGRRIAESLVKELTGGDRVRARRMREDFWEFAPTHHVWLAGNHKPTIAGTDHGIWRRIKLIPFNVVIPEAEQDKTLPEKLKRESAGILNWAIAGCLEWQQNGLQEPENVQAATKGYSNEMDVIGEFIGDHCELGDFTAPATELYKAFQVATGSGMTQQSFGADLRRREFVSSRMTCGPHKAKHCWKGLRLRTDATGERVRRATAKVRASRKTGTKGSK